MMIGKYPTLHIDQAGMIRVGRSHVALDDIVDAHRQGHLAQAILARFPGLSSDELQSAIDYSLAESADAAPRGVVQRDAHWRRWNATAEEDTGTDTPPNEPIVGS